MVVEGGGVMVLMVAAEVMINADVINCTRKEVRAEAEIACRLQML